jgi:hypothetical protein
VCFNRYITGSHFIQSFCHTRTRHDTKDDAYIEWDEASMPFKDKDAKIETSLHIENVGAVQETTSCMKRTYDATYKTADLSKTITECTQLSKEHQTKH